MHKLSAKVPETCDSAFGLIDSKLCFHFSRTAWRACWILVREDGGGVWAGVGISSYGSLVISSRAQLDFNLDLDLDWWIASLIIDGRDI